MSQKKRSVSLLFAQARFGLPLFSSLGDLVFSLEDLVFSLITCALTLDTFALATLQVLLWRPTAYLVVKPCPQASQRWALFSFSRDPVEMLTSTTFWGFSSSSVDSEETVATAGFLKAFQEPSDSAPVSLVRAG